MDSRQNQTVEGDLLVNHDATIGGTLRVRRYIHPHGALYREVAELRNEWPSPEVGMWALVGSSFPFEIWRCRIAGMWELVAGNQGDNTGSTPSTGTGLDIAQLKAYLDTNLYATQTWVRNQGYLTELPDGSIGGGLDIKALATYLTENEYVRKNEMRTELDKKLDKSKFDELFEKVTLPNGTTAIRAKFGLYSDQFLSCKRPADGIGSEPSTGGTGLDIAQLKAYLDTNLYATQTWVKTWVNDQGFLKEGSGDKTDIDLSVYATKAWVEEQGFLKTMPDDLGDKIDLTAYLKKADAAEYLKNADIFALKEHEHQKYLEKELAVEFLKDYYVRKTGDTMTGPLVLTDGATLTIGGVTLSWDEETHMLAFSKGIYSLGAVSAKGSATDPDNQILLGEFKDYLQKEGYVTQQWVEQQGYLTDAPTTPGGEIDLTGYATQAWVEQQDYAKYSNVDGVNNLVPRSATVSGSTLKFKNWNGADLFNVTIPVSSSSDVDLTGYATQTWVRNQGYLTSHQSLTGYLTTADAKTLYQPKGNYLTSHQSLSAYLTTADAKTLYQPKGNYLTSHQDLSHLVTLGTAQTISAAKTYSALQTFSAGIKIGNVTITYDTEKKGLHVTGGGLYTDTYLSAKKPNTTQLTTETL